jgi:hypothetical protein
MKALAGFVAVGVVLAAMLAAGVNVLWVVLAALALGIGADLAIRGRRG